jgi:hypothetical protein
VGLIPIVSDLPTEKSNVLLKICTMGNVLENGYDHQVQVFVANYKKDSKFFKISSCLFRIPEIWDMICVCLN